MHFLVLLTALVACAAGVPLNNTKLTLEERIVGGTTTTIDEHPYQVSLRRNGAHICSGSIISPTCVVTAAHCVVGATANQLTIQAGSTTLNVGGTIHNVTVFYIHGSYNITPFDYDVAVLKVDPPFTYSNSVHNILLQESAVSGGTSVVVTGWGLTATGGFLSTTLRKVTLQTISQLECAISYPVPITSRMICAGVLLGGKAACDGDSGGPLVAAGNKLVGIVSWGRKPCGQAFSPDVFTKVSALRDWILFYCSYQPTPMKLAVGPAVL